MCGQHNAWIPRMASTPSPACSRIAGRSNTSSSSGDGGDGRDGGDGEATDGEPSGRATDEPPLPPPPPPLLALVLSVLHSWMLKRLHRKVQRKLPGLTRLGMLAEAGDVAAASPSVAEARELARAVADSAALASAASVAWAEAEEAGAAELCLPSCVERVAATIATCSAVIVSAAASSTNRRREGRRWASKPRALDSHTPLSAAIAAWTALATSHGRRGMAAAGVPAPSAPSRHCHMLSHRI